MNARILQAAARRDHLASEIRRVRGEIRDLERDSATDPRLLELRTLRRELLDELRSLDLGVEFARVAHP